jgi:hypothetical protein
MIPMKASKVLTTIFSHALLSAVLFLFVTTSFAATTSQIATIGSATTDGTASSSTFQLSVTSGQLANALTTSSDIELSLALAPQESHRGLMASVYTVIVAGGKFFKLTEDGSYASWNGTVEDLTPFATNQLLENTNRFTLLNGKMAEAGSYLYFAAYSVEGETRLLFTPNPAQIAVAESDVLPDETASVAAETFEMELESAVIQAKCILCHVEGGLARSSSLQFQRTNTASALNNFSSLSAYIEEKGADLLLSKITGGDGHAGGLQLSQDSDGYKAFERVITAINELDNPKYYAFSGSSEDPSARQASFLTEVTLEPRESTLRRATLLLQGRMPTSEEREAVDSDDELRKSLLDLMQGEAFREFVVTGVNDRLLIEGADTPLDINFPMWFKLYDRKVKYALDEDPDNDFTLNNQLRDPIRRAGGELFAYVMENNKPYSEVLTADYMMMNKFLNNWLEGSANFGGDESGSLYKPSRIGGYYPRSSLNKLVERVNSNSSYELTGPPMAEYPHAGILSDFGFLGRYPTTATNRNRARARWAFYHFLGIDIEKSSQRPTDEASLSDRNNPTMNNPNCTVCHALLDPVAGAFQNWDEFNHYRNGGSDALDRFYKRPEDGTKSLYQYGDLWYRDMRSPGLFDKKIEERDATLRELAELIIDDPAFLTATAKFWWPSVFGKPLLDKPAVESDQGYASKYAAYQAQQDAIDEFAAVLGKRMSAKDMLVEMIMSPWFSGESVTSYAFNEAQYEAQFGSKQLLTPEQLGRKTRALTGVSWRSNMRPSGTMSSAYEAFNVLLGGIDSDAVTTRATELTPTMTSILMTHATESACPAVVRQFAKPIEERSLFSYVEETMQPLVLESRAYTLASETREDWNTISLSKSISPGDKTFSLKFLNRYCDYDGVSCVEQRTLFLKSLTISSPSGLTTKVQAADPRVRVIGKYCSVDWQGDMRFGDSCTVEVDLSVSETGNYTLSAELSAEIPALKGGLAEVSLSINENTDVLSADTPNSRAIRNQIVELFAQLHGKRYTTSSTNVTQVYEIFNAALMKGPSAHSGIFYQCSLWKDGLLYDDNLTQKEIATFRTVQPNNDWYSDDWEARRVFEHEFMADPFYSKYAWTAVMMYMLSHYDYLHE